MIKTPTFKDYSMYYDLLYAEKNYKAETEYILNLIKKYHGKSKKILELGSGTSRHAIEFAKTDRTITCVEMSKEMQALAFQNLAKTSPEVAKKITLVRSDARKFRSNEKFDAAISLFHVINYQTKNSDIKAFLKTASMHLKKNSLFIFDFWYGPGVLTDLPTQRKKTVKNSDFQITRNTHPNIFYEKNICEVSFDVQIDDLKKKQFFQVKETHPMRYLFLPEVANFAEESGFDLIGSHEWMSTKPLSGTPFSATAVLRKN